MHGSGVKVFGKRKSLPRAGGWKGWRRHMRNNFGRYRYQLPLKIDKRIRWSKTILPFLRFFVVKCDIYLNVLLLMKVHCMIFLWPVIFSCQDSGAWAQWHFFNLSIFKEFTFLANQYFGSGSRVSETFWYLGQFCQLTPGGNWSCCIRRATVLELGERGEELPKARQVWPHNERYLHPTKSRTLSQTSMCSCH